MISNYEQVRWEDLFEEGFTQIDIGKSVLLSGQGKGGVSKHLDVTTRFYSDGRHKIVYLLKVKGWDVTEYYESRIALMAYNEA